MKVRTRMAPSPTGEFHIGGMRTLLYDYALAKHHSGEFVLRIEDTDQNRKVEGALEGLLEVIKAYGLPWDEGPEVGGPHAPYTQSERLDLYQKYVKELIENEHAYYCFCSSERLKEVREEQQKNRLPTKYDGHCRHLSKESVQEKLDSGQDYVIRLRVPENKVIKYHDEVYGDLEVNSSELDDQVLQKSDCFPTYHLAVVVDDHLMGITHVLRGNDWIPSTPKHVLLYEAFGWKMPTYVHLPNLKEVGGTKKLSKRNGSTAAHQFLEEGYIPEALLNFLMFLGWNPGTDKEIYSLDEFVSDFDISKIHKTDLVAFDRNKLLWTNGIYIRDMEPEVLLTEITNWAEKYNKTLTIAQLNKDELLSILKLVQERLKVLSEVEDLTSYFVEDPSQNIELLAKFAKSPERAKEILESFSDLLSEVDENKWKHDHLDALCHKLIEDKAYKPKEAFMTVRVAVSGKTATPPLFDMLEVLKKEKVLKRIGNSIKILS